VEPNEEAATQDKRSTVISRVRLVLFAVASAITELEVARVGLE
jgi:hypothetical protein